MAVTGAHNQPPTDSQQSVSHLASSRFTGTQKNRANLKLRKMSPYFIEWHDITLFCTQM